MCKVTTIKTRIHEIVNDKFGRVEEELMAAGIIDSLRAIQLAMALEKEFALEADSFELSDMRTISSISERILKNNR